MSKRSCDSTSAGLSQSHVLVRARVAPMGPVSVPDRGSCEWRAAIFPIAVTVKAFAVEWVYLGVGSPSTRIVRSLLGSSLGCVQLGAPDPALLATSRRHARLQDRRYIPQDDYLCEHTSMLVLGAKSRTPPESKLANRAGKEARELRRHGNSIGYYFPNVSSSRKPMEIPQRIISDHLGML